MIRDYTHSDLGREIRAIGGYYMLEKEVRLPFGEREVLYLVGHAVLDNSCCGAGGFRYALVPGFVVDWQSKHSGDGEPVSEIEPIKDDEIRREVSRVIEREEVLIQVQFQ